MHGCMGGRGGGGGGGAVTQHIIFGQVWKVQNLETPTGIQEGSDIPQKKTEESTILANVVACGTKIFLKIHPIC